MKNCAHIYEASMENNAAVQTLQAEGKIGAGAPAKFYSPRRESPARPWRELRNDES